VRGVDGILNIESQDTTSIADLFEASRDRLFRYALSLCKTLDRADDLVQETFLRALKHSHTLARMNDFQRDAWLKRVLRNRFFDEQRSRKRANAAVVEMIRHAHRHTDTAALIGFNEILDRIPDQYRGVLEKRYHLGMNSTEIGTELGIPATTVRSHLHQAVRWLRDRMAESIR
jgi:RNA polymerase sigma-70 factor (ECF subfamily)